MARAYLRISVDAGREQAVLKALRKIKGVRSADLTSGEQDVIALIEANSYDALLDLVVKKVRAVRGLRSTATSLVLE